MDKSLTKIRHERSKKDFPFLNLEEDEYVEVAFKRARVCLFLILGGTGLATIILLLALLLTLLGQSMLDDMGKNFIFIILFSLLAATFVIAIFASIVYRGNKLFVTNRRAIQMVMDSPVSSSVNIIDLHSIEDASFHKKGLLQTMLNYGTLRLATVGDETTYTFKYSDASPEEIKIITKLITNAKKTPEKKPCKHETNKTSDGTTDEVIEESEKQNN